MATSSEGDLATQTLLSAGLIGAEEVPSAADYQDTIASNGSVIATLTALGLPIWNGSALSVPIEYLVELAMRCSLPIRLKNGLIDELTYLRLIDESERRLTVMAAPRGATPSIARADDSTGRRGAFNWALGR